MPFTLWQLLMQNIKLKPHKYSRAEAYYDLLCRQRLTLLTGDYDCLPGTIQKLSQTWSWDRSTVNRFIISLVDIGVASIINISGRKAVRLDGLRLTDKFTGTSPDAQQRALNGPEGASDNDDCLTNFTHNGTVGNQGVPKNLPPPEGAGRERSQLRPPGIALAHEVTLPAADEA